MANDFDIIRTGSELASRGPQTSNTSGNGVNWWLVGGSLVVLVAVGVMAHQAGKNTVMPKLSAANEENEKLKKNLSECPYQKAKNLNSSGHLAQNKS